MTFSERWAAFKRICKYQYLRIMRLSVSTHNIAMGLAAGVFVGFLPVIPFQTVIALALAFLVRGSKIAAALGTWVSNPVNLIPFYAMLYYVGSFIVPVDAVFDVNHLELESLLEQGWGIVIVMFTGGVVLGIPAAIITYIVSFRAIAGYRKRRMIKLLRKYNKEHGKA